MNKTRRTAISSIRTRIEELKEELEMLQEEEQMAFDNLPESLQGSDRGLLLEGYVGIMADAVSDLENAIDNLDIEEV